MIAVESDASLGRYRLIALLGRGGMAEVFLACAQGPVGFHKLLVVKRSRCPSDPEHAAMFFDEARIAAQLEHPNLVQTYEIIEHAGRHYIVMEYIDGANLTQLWERSGISGISLRVALTILLHVLDGLAYAHTARGLAGRALQVVHRDLSPSNIMVTAHGGVKILDFGIARATGQGSTTKVRQLAGKLGYMPPEQLRDEPADPRDDLFACGAILAEAALGARLWGRLGDAEIAVQLGNHQIPALDRRKPLSPALRAICERALAPARDQRYPSARAFRADLERYLGPLGGPVAPAELAQLVCTAMEPERSKLHSIVDGHLQRIGAEHGWDNLLTSPEQPLLSHAPPPPFATPPPVFATPRSLRAAPHVPTPGSLGAAPHVPAPAPGSPAIVPHLPTPTPSSPAIVPHLPAPTPVSLAARPYSRTLLVRAFAFGATLLASAIALASLRPRLSAPALAVPDPSATPAAVAAPPPGSIAAGKPMPASAPTRAPIEPAALSPASAHLEIRALSFTALSGGEPAPPRTARDPTPLSAAPSKEGLAPPAKSRGARTAAVPRPGPTVEVAPAAPSKAPLDTDPSIVTSAKRALDASALDDAATSNTAMERDPW